MSFNEKYSAILSVVKADIEKLNNGLVNELNLNTPLNDSLKRFLTAPSKRIRPLLAFLYLRASDEIIDEKQYSLQVAIELIHNASLIHDDVIDEGDFRRGLKSLNKEFNNKLAIISGDYLLSKALKIIGTLDSTELINIFATSMENMCEGEINQYFNRYKISSIDEYILKSKQKTAFLFQTALQGGIMLGSGKNMTRAEEFGEVFGIIFQIRDDLKNVTSSQDTKPVNNDIESGVYNAPVIFAQNTEDLTDGIEKTQLLLENYIERAYTFIKPIGDNKYKRALKSLLELFKNE